jgi:hypothetical protein
MILILSLALVSCSKEWNCTITTNTVYGTSVTHMTMHGTNAEKEDFENTLTPGQNVECH